MKISLTCLTPHTVRFILVPAFILLLGSCDDSNKETSPPPADTSSITSNQSLNISPAGCYEMILNKDSATLIVEMTDTMLGGKLDYLFFEKDQNLGTISGTWKDSMVHAFYTFRSEGVISVR